MIRYYLFSDKGGREINEDAVGHIEHDGKHCFVLCDGLGGHGMGDVASSLVRDTAEGLFKDYNRDSMIDFLTEAFEVAQQRLCGEQDKRNARNKMKTTCIILATDNTEAYMGFIGDSRLYIFAGNEILRRTIDHSVPQRLALAGQIKEKEIRHHPDRNKVLHVLGTEWGKAEYELLDSIPLDNCQAFLLCSDGFWECVDDKEMCRMLQKSDSPEEWVEKMALLVKKRNKKTIDKMDNYSAIGVWVK